MFHTKKLDFFCFLFLVADRMCKLLGKDNCRYFTCAAYFSEYILSTELCGCFTFLRDGYMKLEEIMC